MHKLILILSLLLSTSFAYSQTLDSIDLPAISVMANRVSQTFAEENRSIEIITRSEIAAAPVSSTAELLQYAAGVDIRQRGVHGIQADVSIRGGGFDQVLILLNGVKLYDPQTGHHSLNLPVRMENIDRIEVLRGSGARAYGQNAFAGAINIVTKAQEKNQIQVSLNAGDFGTGGLMASVNHAKADARHFFSWSKNFSSGYRYNTDYQLDNFFYQGQSNMGKHELHWLAGYTERAFGANGFYASPAFKDQFESIQTSLVSLTAKINANKWTLKPRISWRRNQDEYIFIKSNPSIYRNVHLNQVYSAEMHSSFRSNLGITGLGFESNFLQLFSNNLGKHERMQLSAFAEHRFQFLDDKISISPGLFLNYTSDHDWQVYPGLDLGIEINDQLKIFADVGLTNRIPTFIDLYYEDPANLGNPALRPESAFSYDAGLKWRPNRAVWLSMAAFQRFGRDIIDWTKEEADDPWRPDNFNQINTSGIELSWRWKPDNLPWLNQWKINYTFLDQKVDLSESITSRYALEHLKHQLQTNLLIRPLEKLYWNIGGRWLDRVSLDNYWVLDTKLTYREQKWNAYLQINNLLNEQYTETNLVPMPGTWTRLGFTYKLMD